MATTQKSVGEIPLPGGPAAVRCRREHRRGWPVWLTAAVLAWLVGCGEPPGERELNEGIHLLSQGQPAAAIAPLQRALDSFTTNRLARAQALNYLGLAFHQTGRREEAGRAYQAALNEDLNLVEARYNRGCLLLETGDVAGARQELDTFVQFRPKNALGWLRLGTARYRSGKFDEADQAFRQAAELSNDRRVRAGALNGAGLCRARRGRTLEAMKFFGAALQTDPQHGPARLNMAIVTEQSQDLVGALEDYETWLETATNAPNRPAVVAHVRRLLAALQPRLPAIAAADSRDLARLTNLFSRVGRLETAPPPAGTPVPSNAPSAVAVTSTGAAPAVATVQTATPPATVTRTGTPPAVAVAGVTSPPPAAVTRPSAPLPALVLTSPAPAITVTSLPPPVVASPNLTNPPVEVASVSYTIGEPDAAGTAEAAPTGPLSRPPAGEAAGAPKPIEEEVVTQPPPVATPLPPVPSPAAAAPPEPAVPEKEVAKLTPAPVPTPAPEPRRPTGLTSPPPTSAGPAEEPAEAAPKKRSFFSRLNPLNLLRRDGKKEEKKKVHGRITPLAPPGTGRGELPGRAQPGPDSTAGAGRRPVSPAVGSESSAAGSPGSEGAGSGAVFARYQYLSPKRPEAGDAAAAQRIFQQGAEAHRDGRLDAAATAYRRAIVTDPTCVEARYNLGTLALARQEYAIALEQFETALAIEPGDPAARFNFALALEEAGYPLDAKTEMLRVLRLEPDNAEAHLALARIYADYLHQTAPAREHYRKVLQLAPNHPQADAIRRWLAGTR